MEKTEKQIERLNAKCKKMSEEIKRYRKYEKGFYILLDYWDSIYDDQKSIVDKQLKKLGL